MGQGKYKRPEAHAEYFAANRADLSSFTIAAQSGTKVNVTVQMQDPNGNNTGERTLLQVYLSDDAEGDGLTGTAPGNGVSIGSAGKIIESLTANKSFWILTDENGKFDLDIDHTAQHTWYLIVIPPDAQVKASNAIQVTTTTTTTTTTTA